MKISAILFMFIIASPYAKVWGQTYFSQSSVMMFEGGRIHKSHNEAFTFTDSMLVIVRIEQSGRSSYERATRILKKEKTHINGYESTIYYLEDHSTNGWEVYDTIAILVGDRNIIRCSSIEMFENGKIYWNIKLMHE